MQVVERNQDLARLPWGHLRLPPFPQVAIRVLSLANQPNVQLQQLCDLISSDAAFASEVLTVANSLAYAPRYPVSSILQAVTVLGANALQGMCMTVGVRAYLGRSMQLPAMRALWRHNLACAVIARRLAGTGCFGAGSQTGGSPGATSLDKDVAYTAGILHDVGRFALSVIQPQEYGALLESYCGSAAGMLAREQELFGWDHCETGLRLIADWKLPSEFNAVVGEHHAPPGPDDSRTIAGWNTAGRNMTGSTIAELIKISCQMADTAGFPAFPGCEPMLYGDLLEQLPASGRHSFPAALDALIVDVAAAIHAIESV